MSVRTSARVWEYSVLSGTELLMLLAIADFSDDDGNAYPSVATLARKCRMQPRNAQTILARLKGSGELIVRPNAGPRGANRYQVTLAKGVQGSAPLQRFAPLQRTAPTPAEDCAYPLQPAAPEPSLNRHEPSFVAEPVGSAAKGSKGSRVAKKSKVPCKTAAAWEAYAGAYRQRYGTDPVRNLKVNGQLASLVDRLGAEEAPEVAAFFVRSDEAFYIQRAHTVDCLLHDAEKLRTMWKTGGRKHSGFGAKDYRTGLDDDGSIRS